MERLAGKIMLQWGWRRRATAFVAGAFAVLALPPFDFFAAMFVSFPVLVWLLDGASDNPDRGFIGRAMPAFGVGWWFGFGYFVAGLWWLGAALTVEAEAFAWAIPLAVFGLPAVLAIFFGLAAALARPLWSDGVGRIAALAACLGLTEWLRGFIFTGFPWNTIGYGAMPVPLAMQSAAVIGLSGVTVLAVLVFAAPALIGTRRGAALGMSVAAVLAAAHLGYGLFVLETAEEAEAAAGGPAIVRIVQPSIPQSAKWDEGERQRIFEAHLELTTRPPADGAPAPTHIVWAETAMPFVLTDTPEALARIADALDEGQVLAAGAVRVEASGPAADTRYYNAITVIDDAGQIVSSADKVHLVPFGEYLPFQDVLASFGLMPIAANFASFTPGAATQPLSFGGLSVLPLICYEAIFPIDELDGDDAPDLILNVTNDAWYGNTPGPYQHFRQAQLRAAETRTPMIRAANNGISAVTDGYGRIIRGLALDAVGVVDAAVPPKPVSNWDSSDRSWNFWLIIGILLTAAVIARSGFIRR